MKGVSKNVGGVDAKSFANTMDRRFSDSLTDVIPKSTHTNTPTLAHHISCEPRKDLFLMCFGRHRDELSCTRQAHVT